MNKKVLFNIIVINSFFGLIITWILFINIKAYFEEEINIYKQCYRNELLMHSITKQDYKTLEFRLKDCKLDEKRSFDELVKCRDNGNKYKIKD